ncbi:DUF29 [Candidatus Magnetomoraceae bacterium gMMP-15]
MEELFELRDHIEHERYTDALTLLGEMEEMSKDDKINKIISFIEILLIHIIKQHAEKRSTRSWEVSIYNSLRQIKRTNKRRKAGGYYLKKHEFQEAIDDAWYSSLARASLEAFEGRFDFHELAEKIDEKKIKQEAIEMIQNSKIRI